MPLPWRDEDRQANPDGTLSQRIRAVQREQVEAEGEGGPFGHIYSYAIAPDPRWPSGESQRVIVASRPGEAFGRYEVGEYLLPRTGGTLFDFVRDYYFDPAALARFEDYQVADAPQRQV